MIQRPLQTAPHATARVDSGRAERAGRAWLSWRLRLRRAPLRVHGIGGLACLPFCIACMLLCDVPMARLAVLAPADVKDVAAVFSDLGLSGYMLVLSLLAATAAHGALRRPRSADRAGLLKLIRDRALFVFAAVALSGIAVQVIKHVVGRARPALADRVGAFHFDHFSFDPDLASFPSGHSTSIFALAAAIGLIVPRLRFPAFTLAIAVGCARVILSAHYVSDIMAGAILGTVMTLWVATVFAARSIAFTRVRGTLRLKGRGMILSALRPLIPCARTGA